MSSQGPRPESENLQDYLESSEIIDWHTPDIRLLADVLVAGARSDVDKAKRLYEWVRDEIPHSADAGHEIVTCRASEVLRNRTAICYPKAHLLAALLRAAGIPAGLCYQVLRYDASSERLVAHGLNGIYLESLGRWIRVDARGNKPGVNSQFCLDREQLAFPVDPALGEFTSETIFARPLSNIVACLTSHDSVTELMANLPDSIEQPSSHRRNEMSTSYFDQSAATWDNEPRRIALMKDVGEAILQQAKPTKDMDVLDYGCGTGLVSLFLLPHVHNVTGADNSPGMLDVLNKKIAEGGIETMKVIRLDLERDPLPSERYHLIVTSMTMHHVADTAHVLRAFHGLLHSGGKLCIADLDTEPGVFHPPEAAGSVHHHGFDRDWFKGQLAAAGFTKTHDVTAHTVHKPVENGGERAFPVFLITANG